MTSRGRVSLVGAGPGDPGLMTVRALELVAAADVIFYDRLIPPTALSGARPDAELVYVGKAPGVHQTPQAEINRMIVAAARAGSSVVRLKGGDPFLFGRGAEEAEALVEAGIEFEVVPGVTAAVAATATAGIPLTHRGRSSAVAFATGHSDARDSGEGFDQGGSLARFPGTLVLYMGFSRLAVNAESLIAGGRPPDEPVAVIASGTTAGQRVVVGTLATIAERVAAAGLEPPVLTVVGDVVRCRERLAWFERRPLFGRRVVVTRARPQAGRLSAALRGLGAEVVELPVIRIEPLPADGAAIAEPVARLAAGGFDLVCFTSPNGVDRFFAALAEHGLDARALAGAEVAVIGPGTGQALAERGVTADITPPRAVAESLLQELSDRGPAGRRVLIGRAERARDVLPDGLAAGGAEVTVMPLYRTVADRPDPEMAKAAARADAITFSSASTVRFYLEASPGGLPAGARAISIGPITTAALTEAGIEVAREADASDIEGLVAAVVAELG